MGVDEMGQMTTAIVATLLSMGMLDAIWLSTMTSRLYRREMPSLLLETPSWAPAVAFYLLYAVGVVLLVVRPALDGDWTLARAAGTGALLGLVAYGTYDLTNQATLRGWSALVTAVDLTWGATLTAVVATVAVAAARRVG
jgi:uncharacterized membrane protein